MTQAQDRAEDRADARTEAARAADAGKSQTVKIVAHRPLKVGDTTRKQGELLGTVTLEPDVSLGYLTRAIEDGLAGVEPAPDEVKTVFTPETTSPLGVVTPASTKEVRARDNP